MLLGCAAPAYHAGDHHRASEILASFLGNGRTPASFAVYVHSVARRPDPLVGREGPDIANQACLPGDGPVPVAHGGLADTSRSLLALLGSRRRGQASRLNDRHVTETPMHRRWRTSWPVVTMDVVAGRS